MALMVGVSGIRGTVNRTLTPQLVLEFCQAYGTYLKGGRVVLARDTRPSGEMFAAAAAAGLLAAGCEVTRLGVVMTPTAGRAIRNGGFAGGVIITASHNPPEYNGVKFLDDQGLAPSPQTAAEIAAIQREGRFQREVQAFKPMTVDDQAGERHMEAVLGALEVDTAGLRGTKVVLDSVNGAGCVDTPGFFGSLGCDLVHLNGEPTGEFAHMPEPVRENLTGICAAVREQGAAVGFAQDPDADRVAIIDERGEYIGEEYTLALSVLSVLSRRPGAVVANLSTSRMVDDVAARFDCPVFRTAVGEANVARGMLEHDAVIGGEGNGGVIDPRIGLVRDSVAAMSLVLQHMAATGKTLSELVEQIPRYVMIKQKFECPRERIAAAVEAVKEAFADRPLNDVDGVRVDFDDGWVHLRGSNTEPIVRIIGESSSAQAAEALIKQVRETAAL